MLEIRNLSAGYDDLKILRQINLEISPEEIITIIGPNGSGKSTLLRSIFNLCSIYSGEIFFNGKNIAKMPTYKVILEGINYVPQGRQIFANMTVRENLEMGGFILNNMELLNENAKKVFIRFPVLEKRKDEYAFNLSGGEQQILSIARALMLNPSLLILDEPSLGLSPKMINEIFEIIKRLNQDGLSIVFVEQNVKKAVENADRIIVLEYGQIAMMGGHEILNDSKIKDLYFGGIG